MKVVKPNNEKEPFVRGILAHKLIQRGLPFEQAYQIATETKTQFGKRELVPVQTLVETADQLIQQHYGAEMLEQLKPPWHRTDFEIHVGQGQDTAPFSKGLLALSISSAGIPPQDAHQMALRIESRLIRKQQEVVTKAELFERVQQTLQRTYGEETATLYRLSNQLDKLPKPLIVCIGGGTGTGKSALATTLGTHLGIHKVIGTDTIREIMRLVFTEELLPTLHTSSSQVGELLKLRGNAGSEQVLAGYQLQAQHVGVGIRATIRRSIEEQQSVILEGVHLLPFLLEFKQSPPEGAYVVTVLISLLNPKHHRSRFAARAQESPNRPEVRYLRQYQQIRKIHDYCVTQCNKHEVEVVNNEQFDTASVELIHTVMQSLHQQLEQEKTASAELTPKVGSRSRKPEEGNPRED